MLLKVFIRDELGGYFEAWSWHRWWARGMQAGMSFQGGVVGLGWWDAGIGVDCGDSAGI